MNEGVLFKDAMATYMTASYWDREMEWTQLVKRAIQTKCRFNLIADQFLLLTVGWPEQAWRLFQLSVTSHTTFVTNHNEVLMAMYLRMRSENHVMKHTESIEDRHQAFLAHNELEHMGCHMLLAGTGFDVKLLHEENFKNWRVILLIIEKCRVASTIIVGARMRNKWKMPRDILIMIGKLVYETRLNVSGWDYEEKESQNKKIC